MLLAMSCNEIIMDPVNEMIFKDTLDELVE
jgi:hypothetical protein